MSLRRKLRLPEERLEKKFKRYLRSGFKINNNRLKRMLKKLNYLQNSSDLNQSSQKPLFHLIASLKSNLTPFLQKRKRELNQPRQPRGHGTRPIRRQVSKAPSKPQVNSFWLHHFQNPYQLLHKFMDPRRMLLIVRWESTMKSYSNKESRKWEMRYRKSWENRLNSKCKLSIGISSNISVIW